MNNKFDHLCMCMLEIGRGGEGVKKAEGKKGRKSEGNLRRKKDKDLQDQYQANRV